MQASGPVQALPIPPVAPAEAEPYGPIGLLIGSFAIGLLTILLCGLAAGLVFGVTAALHGTQEALRRVVALRPADGADNAFLVQAGIIVSLVVYTAVVLAIVIVARVRAGRRWPDIVALHRWNPFRGTRMFWAAAGLGFLYNLGASALISWVYPASKDWIATPKEPIWILGFVLLAAVLAPIAEEMVFRGWLYTSLKRTIGLKAAIGVTSVLFALAHWESTHLYALAVLPVGLVLGIIREKTGTIVASMTFHAFYNGAASVLLVFGG